MAKRGLFNLALAFVIGKVYNLESIIDVGKICQKE